MYDELQEMGPVDYLCIEFPQGSMRGTALPLLLDLVDRKIIRILDMLFVRCGPDGSVFTLDGGELEKSGLGAFHGAASGLLGGDDLRDIGTVLKPGSAAVLLVYENLWAAPLATTLRRNGAQLVAGGRIAVQDLLAVLEATEQAEAQAISSAQGR
jgi:hypothetical protein